MRLWSSAGGIVELQNTHQDGFRRSGGEEAGVNSWAGWGLFAFGYRRAQFSTPKHTLAPGNGSELT